MKKTKLITSILLAIGLVGMTGCSLFNDDDIAIKNSYNPHQETPEPDADAVVAGGVAAKEDESVPGALFFKNIPYVEEGNKITNTYAVGKKNHAGYNVNSGEDYPSNASSNNYDLYVPGNLVKSDKQTVILFIHGGAWVSGFKTDVNPYVHEFANRGYITATIKYTLLRRTMDDPSLSIFRDLDEIDACIKSMKSVLGELGFDTSKLSLVIGGASSGAHLSMLYSYSRGQDSAIPIKFIIDAVGPTDIKEGVWQFFKSETDEALDGELTPASIAAQSAADNLGTLKVAGESYNWDTFHTMKIANGMCGLPFSLETVQAATDAEESAITDPSNAAYVSMTKDGGGEDQLSVTYWINHSSNRFDILCAYAGKDTIVGVSQYANLKAALDAKSITNDYVYFRDCGHTNISDDASHYNTFLTKIDNWCKAI